MVRWVLAFLLAGAGMASADGTLPDPVPDPVIAPQVAEVVIGLYCADPAARPADPGATGPDAVLYLSQRPAFVSLGQQVPARVGMAFGVAFRPEPGLAPPFDITLHHPPLPGLATTTTTWQSLHPRDGWHIDGYSFETLAVARPGLWTYRARHRGRLLYEVTFEVVPATLRPDLAALCP
jgi:hypothetical protein